MSRIPEDVGQRLRHIRGDRTQQEFAELLGLTRSALANYETGRTKPKLSSLRQIAEKLEFEERWYLEGRELHAQRIAPWHAEQMMDRMLEASHPLENSGVWSFYTPDERCIIDVLGVCSEELVARLLSEMLAEAEGNPQAAARFAKDPHRAAKERRLRAIIEAGGRYRRSPDEVTARSIWEQYSRIVRNRPAGSGFVVPPGPEDLPSSDDDAGS
ncbi:MAG: helix-turn-helix domain-containing protein [Alkalilacustris sp.]